MEWSESKSYPPHHYNTTTAAPPPSSSHDYRHQHHPYLAVSIVFYTLSSNLLYNCSLYYFFHLNDRLYVLYRCYCCCCRSQKKDNDYVSLNCERVHCYILEKMMMMWCVLCVYLFYSVRELAWDSNQDHHHFLLPFHVWTWHIGIPSLFPSSFSRFIHKYNIQYNPLTLFALSARLVDVFLLLCQQQRQRTPEFFFLFMLKLWFHFH